MSKDHELKQSKPKSSPQNKTGNNLYTQQKKLRKLCLRGYDIPSTPFLDVLISESYEVSNLLPLGALFEFLAPIVAEKSVSKSTGLHAIFCKIAILFGLSKECHC